MIEFSMQPSQNPAMVPDLSNKRFPTSSNLQEVTDNGATTTHSIEAQSFVTTGGTSTDFVKGDGTLDGTTYLDIITASTTYATLASLTKTAGSVLFAGADGLPTEDNTNLFYDDTNNRLGIGTSSPAVPLDVVGSTFPVFRATRTTTLTSSAASAFSVALQKTDGNPTAGFGPGFIFQAFDNTGNYNNVGSIYGVLETFVDSVNGGGSGGLQFGVFENSASPSLVASILSTGEFSITTSDVNNRQGLLTISSGDTSVGAAQTIGSLRYFHKDASVTSSELASIRAISESAITSTATVDGSLAFFTTLNNTPTEAMRILSSGNVGIGTTAPSKFLEIAIPATGNYLGQGLMLSRGAGYFKIGNGTGTNNFIPLFEGKGTYAGNATAMNFVGLTGDDADTTNGVMNFSARNNAGTGVIQNTQTAFTFQNYTTRLMSILGNGNVGIGTTTPLAKLAVIANSASFTPITIGTNNNFVANFADNINDVSGVQMGNVSTGVNADFRFLIKDGTGHYFAFMQPGTGNNQVLLGLNRNSTNYIASAGGTGRDMAMATFSANSLVLGTNSLERMRISSAGLVGIGTTTPNSTLNVNGSFALAYVAKTANYTLTASDYTVDFTANNCTATLPTAVGITGRIYQINNSGTGTLTIATTSSQTINGEGSGIIKIYQYEQLTVQSSGTNWIVIH